MFGAPLAIPHSGAGWAKRYAPCTRAGGESPRRSRPISAAHLGEDSLSEREIRVLRCVAQGNSNKRVAVELGITDKTVKAHMKSIISKLNANDRTHAVTIALRRGILEL